MPSRKGELCTNSWTGSRLNPVKLYKLASCKALISTGPNALKLY